MKYLFLAIGFISLALGIVGIVLPLLPTTPFLLLSGICFAKSSDRVNNWFKTTKLYKQYVQSYVESKSMEKNKKIKLLSIVTALFLIGMYFVKSTHIRLFMLFVLLAHYYYFILKVKTVEKIEN